MKKRRKVLAALISLLALAASIRIVYVSGFLTHNYPAQNTHVFTKKGDPLRCDGITYRAGDTSGTRRGVLRPGTNWNTQIEVSNLRIERWHKRATIGIYAGKLRNVTAEGGGADLALGESFTFEGVGTITLLDVGIYWLEFMLGRDKAGDTATYCFEPAPGFNVGDDYKNHYQKQHPDTPTPWSTTPAKQTETTPLPTDW